MSASGKSEQLEGSQQIYYNSQGEPIVKPVNPPTSSIVSCFAGVIIFTAAMVFLAYGLKNDLPLTFVATIPSVGGTLSCALVIIGIHINCKKQAEHKAAVVQQEEKKSLLNEFDAEKSLKDATKTLEDYLDEKKQAEHEAAVVKQEKKSLLNEFDALEKSRKDATLTLNNLDEKKQAEHTAAVVKQARENSLLNGFVVLKKSDLEVHSILGDAIFALEDNLDENQGGVISSRLHRAVIVLWNEKDRPKGIDKDTYSIKRYLELNRHAELLYYFSQEGYLIFYC